MEIDSNNKDTSIKSWWKKFTHLNKQTTPKEGSFYIRL